MQTLQTTSLRVSENQLFILDQQALPQEKRWLAADNVALLVDHIHALRVRGAPLIGLSASLLLALLARRGLSRDELAQALETLRAARPTAVNLMNNLDRMKLALAEERFPQALEAEALRLIEVERARKMLAKGADIDAVLEALSKGLTAKFLHGPQQALHHAQGDERKQLVTLLPKLFRPRR